MEPNKHVDLLEEFLALWHHVDFANDHGLSWWLRDWVEAYDQARRRTQVIGLPGINGLLQFLPRHEQFVPVFGKEPPEDPWAGLPITIPEYYPCLLSPKPDGRVTVYLLAGKVDGIMQWLPEVAHWVPGDGIPNAAGVQKCVNAFYKGSARRSHGVNIYPDVSQVQVHIQRANRQAGRGNRGGPVITVPEDLLNNEYNDLMLRENLGAEHLTRLASLFCEVHSMRQGPSRVQAYLDPDLVYPSCEPGFTATQCPLTPDQATNVAADVSALRERKQELLNMLSERVHESQSAEDHDITVGDYMEECLSEGEQEYKILEGLPSNERVFAESLLQLASDSRSPMTVEYDLNMDTLVFVFPLPKLHYLRRIQWVNSFGQQGIGKRAKYFGVRDGSGALNVCIRNGTKVDRPGWTAPDMGISIHLANFPDNRGKVHLFATHACLSADHPYSDAFWKRVKANIYLLISKISAFGRPMPNGSMCDGMFTQETWKGVNKQRTAAVVSEEDLLRFTEEMHCEECLSVSEDWTPHMRAIWSDVWLKGLSVYGEIYYSQKKLPGITKKVAVGVERSRQDIPDMGFLLQAINQDINIDVEMTQGMLMSLYMGTNYKVNGERGAYVSTFDLSSFTIGLSGKNGFNQFPFAGSSRLGGGTQIMCSEDDLTRALTRKDLKKSPRSRSYDTYTCEPLMGNITGSRRIEDHPFTPYPVMSLDSEKWLTVRENSGTVKMLVMPSFHGRLDNSGPVPAGSPSPHLQSYPVGPHMDAFKGLGAKTCRMLSDLACRAMRTKCRPTMKAFDKTLLMVEKYIDSVITSFGPQAGPARMELGFHSGHCLSTGTGPDPPTLRTVFGNMLMEGYARFDLFDFELYLKCIPVKDFTNYIIALANAMVTGLSKVVKAGSLGQHSLVTEAAVNALCMSFGTLQVITGGVGFNGGMLLSAIETSIQSAMCGFPCAKIRSTLSSQGLVRLGGLAHVLGLVSDPDSLAFAPRVEMINPPSCVWNNHKLKLRSTFETGVFVNRALCTSAINGVFRIHPGPGRSVSIVHGSSLHALFTPILLNWLPECFHRDRGKPTLYLNVEEGPGPGRLLRSLKLKKIQHFITAGVAFPACIDGQGILGMLQDAACLQTLQMVNVVHKKLGMRGDTYKIKCDGDVGKFVKELLANARKAVGREGEARDRALMSQHALHVIERLLGHNPGSVVRRHGRDADDYVEQTMEHGLTQWFITHRIRWFPNPGGRFLRGGASLQIVDFGIRDHDPPPTEFGYIGRLPQPRTDVSENDSFELMAECLAATFGFVMRNGYGKTDTNGRIKLVRT